MDAKRFDCLIRTVAGTRADMIPLRHIIPTVRSAIRAVGEEERT